MSNPNEGGSADPSIHSKDYWDIVISQLAKRPSVLLAAGVLIALYAVAIYAPLLANDRPFVFEGTDYGSYRSAHRLVKVAAGDLVDKAERGQAGFDEWLAAEVAKGETFEGSAKESWETKWETTPKTFAAWLAIDRDSLVVRLDVMGQQLAPEHQSLLAETLASADDVVTAALAADTAALTATSETLTTLAGDVRSTLKPAKYGDAAEAGRTVELQPFRTYPVLESLSLVEVFFMVFWMLVLLLPAWNSLINRWCFHGDRLRIRSWRRKKFVGVLLLPLLSVGLWAVVMGETGTGLQAVSLKEALTDEKAQASHIDFTPVAFGMAEINMTEVFRPPTWVKASRMDEEGFYEEGSGSLRADEGSDVPIHGTPVVVRIGEAERNSPRRHILGTDSLGRDIFSRMIWGARISLSVGLISTLLLVSIGTVLGSLAGYFGGWVDIIISRIIEVFQCFPVFFLILIVVSFLGPSILNIMLAIGIFRWTGVARLVRGEFIRLRGQDFVVASEALGASSARTIFRHVLPNAMGPVLVAATFAVASGILTESALSFLGFGVQLPIPSWGSLLVESRNPEYWWIQVFPGCAVFLTVILYNMVGEGVRDALDPRLGEG